MKETDLKKLAEDYAEKHGFRVPYDGTNNFYDKNDVKWSKEGFIAGYKAKESEIQQQPEPIEFKPLEEITTLRDCLYEYGKYYYEYFKNGNPSPGFSGNIEIECVEDFIENVKEQPFLKAALQQGNNLPEQQGWISVEDKLPEEGERVFVYYKNCFDKYYRDIVFYTYGGVHEFDDENDDFPECLNEEKGVYFLPEGFWFNSEIDENLFQRSKVTHWQPLPSPPK